MPHLLPITTHHLPKDSNMESYFSSYTTWHYALAGTLRTTTHRVRGVHRMCTILIVFTDIDSVSISSCSHCIHSIPCIFDCFLWIEKVLKIWIMRIGRIGIYRVLNSSPTTMMKSTFNLQYLPTATPAIWTITSRTTYTPSLMTIHPVNAQRIT